MAPNEGVDIHFLFSFVSDSTHCKSSRLEAFQLVQQLLMTLRKSFFALQPTKMQIITVESACNSRSFADNWRILTGALHQFRWPCPCRKQIRGIDTLPAGQTLHDYSLGLDTLFVVKGITQGAWFTESVCMMEDAGRRFSLFLKFNKRTKTKESTQMNLQKAEHKGVSCE